jgi:hypothetical protein
MSSKSLLRLFGDSPLSGKLSAGLVRDGELKYILILRSHLPVSINTKKALLIFLGPINFFFFVMTVVYKTGQQKKESRDPDSLKKIQ